MNNISTANNNEDITNYEEVRFSTDHLFSPSQQQQQQQQQQQGEKRKMNEYLADGKNKIVKVNDNYKQFEEV